MRLQKNWILQSLIIMLVLIGTLPFTPSRATGSQIDINELDYIYVLGAYDVWIEENLAYVTCGYQGMKVFDISNSSGIKEVGTLVETGGGFAHQIFVKNNIGYIGNGVGGLKVVDLSNPEVPVVLADYQGFGMYSWAVKVIDDVAFVSNGRLGNEAGFVILNVSDPSNPEIIGKYDAEGDATDIEVIGDYVYITAHNGGFDIVDVSNYSQPVLVGQYNGVSDSTEIEVIGNLAYLISYESEPKILDISDPTNISVVSSGFLITDHQFSIKIADDLAYIAALEDGLYVFNVSNPKLPVHFGNYTGGFGSVYRLVIEDDLIYATYQEIGLRILKINGDFESTTVSTPGLGVTIGLTTFIFIIILKKSNFRKKKTRI
ncbi:MAG: LVIVD repeat-containing protein [Candidatus Hermodarchaeota archaeon]